MPASDESMVMAATGPARAALPERKPLRVFYITGLPRSRSAWLSVALSEYRLTSCLHEPLARMASYSPSAVQAVLSAAHTPFAGISDAGLPVVAPDLPAQLPGPIVVVLRDPADVAESLARYLGGAVEAHLGGVALMTERLHAFIERYDVDDRLLVVDFYDLARNDVMRKVWEHLVPGTPFQRRRIESLQRLRIEPVVDRLLDGLTDAARQRVADAVAAAPDPVPSP